MDVPDFPDTHKEGGGIFHAPPHAIEIEQALLGAILINNEVLEKVSEHVNQDDFYDPLHRQLFQEIVRLIGEQRTASPITLRPIFETWEPITPEVTVPAYINRLSTQAGVSVIDYAKTIAALAARRRLIMAAEDIIDQARYAPSDVPTDAIVASAEQQIFALASRGTLGRSYSLETAAAKAVTSISNAMQFGGDVQGITTGLTDLDRMLGGLHRSDLVIVAGRPAMGKTALATGMAIAAARADKGNHVHFFSQEMTAEQLAMRLLAERTEISSEKLRRGMIDEDDLRAVMAAQRDLAAASMEIEETGGLSLASLASKARRQHRLKKTKLIIVDYLQLMSGSGKRNANRVQEITEITTGLKALAKELDVPIVALSQLSRDVEKRADKRPQLSDLRDSGSIEQDADVVMFVYREEYYVNQREPTPGSPEHATWQQDLERCAGTAEVIVGKQRHGPVGTVKLAFQGAVTRFSNLVRDQHAGG